MPPRLSSPPLTESLISNPALHPRNAHRQGYDFAALCEALPALSAYVHPNPTGVPTIDFSDSAAVRLLNEALLRLHYGLQAWHLPEGYLCPPVPGRADYLHHAADLLADNNNGQIPRGPAVRLLDIGTGANGIYLILAAALYGWSAVGTDTDSAALQALQQTLAENPALLPHAEARHQTDPHKLLFGAVREKEVFDLCVCNPPFYASANAAAEASAEKWRKLGRPGKVGRNFGGRPNELWYPGGELAFLQKLITESRQLGTRMYWYTALVSRKQHLLPLEKALQAANAADIRILPMGQGQKRSRILAWTFLSADLREGWRRFRWEGDGS